MRYYYNRILLDSLTIISKPSNDKYVKLKDLYKLNSKKNLFILMNNVKITFFPISLYFGASNEAS